MSKKPKYRKGVFIVTFSKNSEGKIEYLVLKRKLHWAGWEFPKGGKKFFETFKHAVKREFREEVGLPIIAIHKFNEEGKYEYTRDLLDREGISGQTYKLFAVETFNEKVIFDELEHQAFKWEPFDRALKMLKWPNQRRCLRVVNSAIKKEE